MKDVRLTSRPANVPGVQLRAPERRRSRGDKFVSCNASLAGAVIG
jgi:hypothetical protein